MQNPDAYCVVLTRAQYLTLYTNTLETVHPKIDGNVHELAKQSLDILQGVVTADTKALAMRYRPSGAPLSIGEVL